MFVVLKQPKREQWVKDPSEARDDSEVRQMVLEYRASNADKNRMSVESTLLFRSIDPPL